MDAKMQMVKGLELFSGCSRDELEWVLHNGDVIDVRPGTVIANRGGYAKEFIVVVGGSAHATYRDGSEVTLLPGAFFGHEEIAADRPHGVDDRGDGRSAGARLRGACVPRLRRVRADRGAKAERRDRSARPGPRVVPAPSRGGLVSIAVGDRIRQYRPSRVRTARTSLRMGCRGLRDVDDHRSVPRWLVARREQAGDVLQPVARPAVLGLRRGRRLHGCAELSRSKPWRDGADRTADDAWPRALRCGGCRRHGVAPDLRDRGRSRRPPQSFASAVDRVAC